MNKIAITGASGHLGTALISQLIELNDWEIKAQYNSQYPPIEHPNLHWIKGDLSKESLAKLIVGMDYVIHCAAIISITGGQNGRVVDTNVNGTKNVLDTCIQHSIQRLIHVSSTHALQENPFDSEFNETRPYKTSADFAYDYSKAQAEKLVLQEVTSGKIDALIVRPSAIIGPPDFKPSLMGQALMDFFKGKIPAVVKGGYDCVDVRDVATSIISALEKGVKGESYNLTGEYVTIKKLASIAANFGNVKAPKMVVPHWLILTVIPFIRFGARLTKKAPKFTKESTTVLLKGHQNMSHKKAQKVLGHSPRPLEKTIQDTLQWFDHHSKEKQKSVRKSEI